MQNRRMERTVVMAPGQVEAATTEEQIRESGTTAQGIEANAGPGELRHMLGTIQRQVANLALPPSWYPVDPNYLFDEWSFSSDTSAAGTFIVPLSPAIDRPILLNSAIFATPASSTNVLLTITGEDQPRKLSLTAGVFQLNAIAMVIYPNVLFSLTYTTAGAATGGFMELMGLGLRGENWRRY